MVRAKPTLRIPRPDLLPLRLQELLWEDRAGPESPLEGPVAGRLDLDADRQPSTPPLGTAFPTPLGNGELTAHGGRRICIGCA